MLVLPVLTGDRVINLPAVAPGLFYRFVVADPIALAFNAVITPPVNALCNGTLIETNAGAGISLPVAAENTVTFNAVAIAGDYMNVVCDGTRWLIEGISSVQGFTVP